MRKKGDRKSNIFADSNCKRGNIFFALFREQSLWNSDHYKFDRLFEQFKNNSSKKFLSVYLLSFIFTFSAYAGFQLNTYSSHSQIRFSSDPNLKPKLKELSLGFEVFIPSMTALDFGVGTAQEEKKTLTPLPLKDQRVKNLRLKETESGVVLQGDWIFETGESSPAEKKMISFLYRERNSPDFILDFWPKEGPSVKQVREKKIREEKLSLIRQAEELSIKRRKRKIAFEEEKKQVEKVARFCDLPLSPKKDIFLQFKPVIEEIHWKKWLPSGTADKEYTYRYPQAQSEDAKIVELALNLYKEQKYALVLRSLEFLNKDYPNHPYKVETMFLKANVLLKLKQDVQALEILKDLTINASQTAAALYSAMFLADLAIENKDYLAALEMFLWLSTHHTSYQQSWVFRLGVAESLFRLKQSDQASAELDWISKNGPHPAAKVEGAARIGDIYFERKQYDRAIAAYFGVAKRFPKEVREFPSLFINRAEALYALGQDDEAKLAYERFLKEFPAHPAGWRAMIRLGEIEGKKEGFEHRKASRKWFVDTINAHPFSPGATLARLWLLPCEDHAGFDLLSASRFFSTEAEDFEDREDVKSQIWMDDFADFRGLSHVRSLVTLGRDDLALSVAIGELQSRANSKARFMVGGLLRSLFRKIILNNIENNRKFEAITFYQDKVGSIPTEVIDGTYVNPDYLLKLSRVASDLNLGHIAEKLIESYEVMEHAEEKVNPFRAEQSESDEIDKGIRESEKFFTYAKALWVSKGTSAIKEINENLKKVVEESEFSYEKEVILALIHEDKKDYKAALQSAIRAQLLLRTHGKMKNEEDLYLSYWIAKLYQKNNNKLAAIEINRGLIRALLNSSQSTSEHHLLSSYLNEPKLELVMSSQASLLEDLGFWGELSSLYQEVLDKGKKEDSIKYALARSLMRTGSDQDSLKAKTILTELAASQNESFWKKLAQEALTLEPVKANATP